MKTVLAYLRTFWRALRRPSQLDADMSDEMRFHIDMEAQRVMEREGVDFIEGRRKAAIAFGGVEKYRGAGRDALGLTWLRGMSTDLKLGIRMLRKFPGLTLVAVFALSLAIGAGAAYLEFINDLMHGDLPFDEGDRIVGIQRWDQRSGDPDHRATADFVAWRGTLRSFADLAAVRTLDRNLITDDGRAEPVRAVEISPAAFRIARVPPLVGRPLLPEDERGGAPPVAVIGYDLWTKRFASDTGAVGRSIRLGKGTYTIVGVMPDGFGLPTSHSLWVPLQLNEAFYPRREGPPTRIFGRLADGLSLREAQAELDAIAGRAAADHPQTDQHIRVVVKPYVESLWSAIGDSRMQTLVFYSANLFFLGLLGLCGANIATLVFARTATREAEISVRTALGASRARIAWQLLAEALVLSAIAAVLGLTFAIYGGKWAKQAFAAGQGRPMSFWWNDRLAPETIAYAALLAMIAAVIVGVTPALKATGPRVQERLKHTTGGSAAGLKFGGLWTGVIVTQIAVTVIFLAIVGMLGWGALTRSGAQTPNFPTTDYVAVRLMLDRTDTEADTSAEQAEAAYRDRFRPVYAELSRRLEAEPAVAAVTYTTRLPGMDQLATRVEVDGVSSLPVGDAAPFVRTSPVGVTFLETFHAPIVAGRAFSPADLAPGRNVTIVDETFARMVLKGQDPIGRHVREAGSEGKPPGPWIEIVGVVKDLTSGDDKLIRYSQMYRPAPPETLTVIRMAVHARTNPLALMSRIRVIAGDVDPALRLEDLQTMDKLGESDRLALDFFARLLGGISAVALLLGTAGVYALMSFTVSRRTSEIGIRVALGANPGRIVWTTFGRALAQVGLGLAAGGIPAAVLVATIGPEMSADAGPQLAIVTGTAATLLVAGITMLACVLPARRALLIQPTDALKAQ